MAKFKGRIIFEVKFKDMHIPLFAIDNIVQKVALHKCAQQIEFWHKMEFHEKKKTSSPEKYICCYKNQGNRPR